MIVVSLNAGEISSHEAAVDWLTLADGSAGLHNPSRPINRMPLKTLEEICYLFLYTFRAVSTNSSGNFLGTVD